jgi:hypothetical protein
MTVLQGGRAKAYRPLPVAARADAVRAGLAAYGRGDVFLAHELLEPAWMGTADIAERELVQGLIKLAAGFVHAARGNPTGVTKNLVGARDHLVAAERHGSSGPVGPGTATAAATATVAPIAVPELAAIDVAQLVAAIDRVVVRVARSGEVPHRRPAIRHRTES